MAYAPGELAAILKGIGAPTTAQNIKALRAWAQAEGGTAKYNPMNTTEPWAGSSNYNSVGVKNYPTEQAGIRATIATLKNGHYAAILQALHAGHNPLAVAQAVGNSPWGTSGSLMASILGGTIHGGSEPAQNIGGGGGGPISGGGVPRSTPAPPPVHLFNPQITLPTVTPQVTPAQALANLLAGDQQQPDVPQEVPLTRQTPSYAGALQALHSGLMRATT